MIDEVAVTARELLGKLADGVGEVDGFLIDDELLEGECHVRPEDERGESREETAGEWGRLSVLLTTFSALLLYLPLANRDGGI